MQSEICFLGYQNTYKKGGSNEYFTLATNQ